jgi:peptidoglycan/LPS O-acetylase OafA/YrhL
MKIKWLSLVRIIGLFSVLLYHFFIKSFPGVFIGVDVFFVFSGYLITSLFFVELEKTGKFDLLAYYKRRFLRIFPPLLIMIVTTLPFTLLLPLDFRANLAKQVAAAIGFVTNKFEILAGNAYEAQQIPQLYVHTWTLSLEFLFYLIWGVLFFILIWLLKRSQVNGKKRLVVTRFIIFVFSIILSLFSIIYLEVTFNPNYLSYSYFSFMAHAYPFFIGATVAVLVGIRIGNKQRAHFLVYPMKKWWFLTTASLLSLVFLIIFGKFESAWTIRVTLLLTSVLAAVLIVQFRILHERFAFTEPKILTVLADTSYNMYLFHWPIWLFISQFISQTLLAGVLSFLISFAVSAVVYYGIEPYFHGKRLEIFLFGKTFYVGLGLLVLVGATVVLTAPKISKVARSLDEARISETMVALDKKGQLAQNLLDTGNAIFENTSWYVPLAGFSTSSDMQLKQQVLKDVAPVSDKIFDGTQTILGDSVMVGVVPYLSTILPDADIDAKVGRNFASIYDLFNQKLQAGQLGDYLVISAGANVTNDMKNDVQKIIDEAPKGMHLVLVTAYDGKNMTVLTTFNHYLQTLQTTYNWVAVADWAGTIASKDDLLWDDKVHFAGKQDVSAIYLNLMVDSLNQVAQTKGKS